MRLVIDANIIFSFLIKQGKTSEILSDLSLRIYAPEYLFQEIQKHKEEILIKTHRSENEFERLLETLREIIIVIPENDFEDYLEFAEEISPDPDDAVYFALALRLNCPIWSNDKKLKQQNKINIHSTEDLINKYI